MQATNSRARASKAPLAHQAGTAAVEFALLAAIFFTFVFGIIEIARIMFVYNTLQEVTRRAAAEAVSVFPNSATALNEAKRKAVFRSTEGELVLADPVSDKHVRIDYLALTRDPVTGNLTLSEIPPFSWPASAARNRELCMSDPNAPTCIRFVRARICDTGDSGQCAPVHLRMLLPLVDLSVPLPNGETIAIAESLGYVQGTAP